MYHKFNFEKFVVKGLAIKKIWNPSNEIANVTTAISPSQRSVTMLEKDDLM